VETIWLQTLSVLFLIHVSTRRVVLAGVTASPDSAWVTQQARNATMDLHDRELAVRFLLRDHDTKFTGGFDEVFRSDGTAIIRTPIQAPKANAYAERWVQTIRGECLDWTLVLGRRHLLWILRGYVRHDNAQRPTPVWRWPFRRRGNRYRCLRGLEMSGAATYLAASSTSIAWSQPDESAFTRPTRLRTPVCANV